jgi:acetyltransferase-like isoleucine patch superfamily enzyme
MQSAKGILLTVLRPVLRAFGSIFYDRAYLRGRYFDQGSGGWLWMFQGILFQRLLGYNLRVPWPVAPFQRVSDEAAIDFHPDDLHNFQVPGCYFQCFGARIVIGKGTYIAPNVGIITSNHDLLNPQNHLEGKDVVLGENCWIGMNAVILPGVHLGARTVVGAGAIVRTSFPEGNCILAGVPAKKVKELL